jgi:hypothetical protein
MENVKKESLIDTIGVISYFLILGTITDYFSGLRGIGIVASRTFGTAINIPTGAPYGKYRNWLYKRIKTTDKSSKVKKYLTELFAFNTFQVPLYFVSLCIGSLVSNLILGNMAIDFNKVKRGTEIFLIISPLIGPIAGLYM